MRVLFVGADTGTSRHRRHAFVRLGHEVVGIDPEDFLPQGRFIQKLHWETGGVFCEKHIARNVLARLGDQHVDYVHVESGRYVGPTLIEEIRWRFGCKIANFNHDDPFGRRDRASWSLFRKAVPQYDLMTVVRDFNVTEAKALGARNVLYVYRTADEVAHAPRTITDEDRARYGSDVLFLGTWFPERGPFLGALLGLGVKLSIRGDRWQKAREWSMLKSAWVGPGTTGDDEYAKLIQCAKINLGLLSEANRDFHTTRSLEIPSLGALFCAERTSEHLAMYTDGVEAVFWRDAEECADVCKGLLNDDCGRRRIAEAGRTRFLADGNSNEKMLVRMLSAVGKG